MHKQHKQQKAPREYGGAHGWRPRFGSRTRIWRYEVDMVGNRAAKKLCPRRGALRVRRPSAQNRVPGSRTGTWRYGIGMVAKCLTVCSSGVLVGIGLPVRCSCCGVSRWCLRFAASSWSTALWLRHPPATAERRCYCRARSCALLLHSEVVVVPSWSVQILFFV